MKALNLFLIDYMSSHSVSSNELAKLRESVCAWTEALRLVRSSGQASRVKTISNLRYLLLECLRPWLLHGLTDLVSCPDHWVSSTCNDQYCYC